MKKTRLVLVGTLLSLLTILSAAAIMAQDSTEEPPAESTAVASSFADNRINGDVFLGGLALYCEDENGNADGNTFQNGAITVWGPDGQKYLELTAFQLRGSNDSDMDMMESTEEPMMEVTAEPFEPVLLAQANTINGTIWFFLNGTDRFTLQGTDNTGKFYSYTWEGCAQGGLDVGAGPIISSGMNMMPTAEMTMEATDMVTPAPEMTDMPEVTPEATEAS
jgi:hypothetical protein